MLFFYLCPTETKKNAHHLARPTCYTSHQELLDACGRAHDLADVYRAIEAVHASGIPSWSLDLISGLPGLDATRWRHSVQEAIKAGPTHISVYDLQVFVPVPSSHKSHQQGVLSECVMLAGAGPVSRFCTHRMPSSQQP